MRQSVHHLSATVQLLPAHRRRSSKHTGSRTERLALQPVKALYGLIPSTGVTTPHLECNKMPYVLAWCAKPRSPIYLNDAQRVTELKVSNFSSSRSVAMNPERSQVRRGAGRLTTLI